MTKIDSIKKLLRDALDERHFHRHVTLANARLMLNELSSYAQTDPPILEELRPYIESLSNLLDGWCAPLFEDYIDRDFEEAVLHGPMVEHDPDTLRGIALNWATHRAAVKYQLPNVIRFKDTGLGATKISGWVELIHVNNQGRVKWEPINNHEQSDLLIDEFEICCWKEGEGWTAMAAKDMGCAAPASQPDRALGDESRQKGFKDSSRLVACLRAAVAYHAYQHDRPITVPEMLL